MTQLMIKVEEEEEEESMKDWYSASDGPELAEFGPVRGPGVTGVGAPGGPEHLAAIQALSAVAAQLLATGCLARLSGEAAACWYQSRP